MDLVGHLRLHASLMLLRAGRSPDLAIADA